jgi:cobalt-zinc-cadmium efflux system protein
VTLGFTLIEAVSGVVSHSLALVSDAGHNFSDALALALAAYALWMAQRPATARHTYGFHRVAILTALFNALTLVVIAVLIGTGAIYRLQHPVAIHSAIMIAVAAIAVVMNTGIAAALSGDAKHSINSRAAFLHMAGDAMSSFAVVVAGIIVHYTHWLAADPVVSILIAVFIFVSSWTIIRDAGLILMESTPRDVDVEAVIHAIKSVPQVRNVHDMHVWSVGDGVRMLSCHVGLPEGSTMPQSANIVRQINETLARDFQIGHATIQTEVESDCEMTEVTDLYCALEPHHAHVHSHSHEHKH